VYRTTSEESHGHTLADMKYFKATEYHNMMLYFMLPVVRHFLPTDYFSHFALLVTAITMLLSQPTHTEVRLADMLLEYFVKEMQPLYGISAMTINVHSLCHLAEQVDDSGPLWSNSMFPFENMVKELGYLYSGTRNTGDQIVQNFTSGNSWQEVVFLVMNWSVTMQFSSVCGETAL
jgi:hypothetical protein